MKERTSILSYSACNSRDQACGLNTIGKSSKKKKKLKMYNFLVRYLVQSSGYCYKKLNYL